MSNDNAPEVQDLLAKIQESMSTELTVLRKLLESAVDELNKTQVLTTTQTESIGRISQQLDQLEKTVIRGNGQHGLLTRVALVEQAVNEIKTDIKGELVHAKEVHDNIEKDLDKLSKNQESNTGYRRAVVVATLASGIAFVGLVLDTVFSMLK